MDAKLTAVLGRLCEQLGPLQTMQAVKLPYLIDVVASRVLGERITDGTHQTWKFGVVTREVWSAIKDGDNGTFEVEDVRYTEERRVRLVGEVPDALTDDEVQVVDFVAEWLGGIQAVPLGKLTKSLNIEVPAEEWGSNQEAALGEDAYVRLSNSWQAFWGQLPTLNLADRESWGDEITNPGQQLRAALDA